MTTQLAEAQHNGLDEVPTLTELANTLGTDKGTQIGDWGTSHGYTRIYEHFLAARRREPLKLLEIGVWKGASLRMWERYFPEAHIVGVDILLEAREAASARSQVVIGDASDPDFLRHVVNTYFGGMVDVVVDDGSHVLDHQLAALETLFPLLTEGGLYFVEDISVSRFEFKGVSRRPFVDFLDYAAWLAEQTTFLDGTNSERYHTILNLNSLTAMERSGIMRNYWNEWLHAVHLFYNMCVLEKHRRELPIPYAFSMPSVLSRSGGRSYALQGLQERFSEVEWKRSNPLAELLVKTKDKLADLEMQVAVATKLAEYSDSLPVAINAAVESAQRQIGPFRDSLRAMERASLSIAEELSRATGQAERAVTKLNRVEAEAEYLRNRLHKLEANEAASDSAATHSSEVRANAATEIEVLQAQLAALRAELSSAETQCIEVKAKNVEAQSQIDRLQAEIDLRMAESATADMRYAEAKKRINTLETELGRGSTEIAQIRLIHAGILDSWKSATAESERLEAKCRMLEQESQMHKQEINELRRRTAESDARINAIYASTSWRIAAPLRRLKLALSRQSRII